MTAAAGRRRGPRRRVAARMRRGALGTHSSSAAAPPSRGLLGATMAALHSLAPPPAHAVATAALLGLYAALRLRVPPDAAAQLPGWEKQSGVALAAAAAIKVIARDATLSFSSSLSDLGRLARIVPLGLLAGLAPAAGAWYALAAAAAVLLFPAPVRASPLADATPAALAAALQDDKRQRGGRHARIALFCDPGGGARSDAAASAVAALASSTTACVQVDSSRWPGAAAALGVREGSRADGATVAARWVGGELVGAVAGAGGAGLARGLGVDR